VRILVMVLIVSLLLILFFYRSIERFSEEVFQPDQNPQLVSYLQGDWVNANDQKAVFRIKRDSIIEIHNDSIMSRKSLYYIFNEAANKYFTKDTAFAFSSDKDSLTTNDFKLREVGKSLNDTNTYILVYVSRSRVKMISRGRALSLNRAK
jgi:hypothetical protein